MEIRLGLKPVVTPSSFSVMNRVGNLPLLLGAIADGASLAALRSLS